jgi:hypothetical protein
MGFSCSQSHEIALYPGAAVMKRAFAIEIPGGGGGKLPPGHAVYWTRRPKCREKRRNIELIGARPLVAPSLRKPRRGALRYPLHSLIPPGTIGHKVKYC